MNRLFERFEWNRRAIFGSLSMASPAPVPGRLADLCGDLELAQQTQPLRGIRRPCGLCHAVGNAAAGRVLDAGEKIVIKVTRT